MSERINVNGLVSPPEGAFVSALDRGFLYGDAVYETIRTYGGRPFRLPEHLRRLRDSAERLRIRHDASPVDIEREVHRTLREADNDESAIRVVLSRGSGPIGYDPTHAASPNVVVYVRPCPAIPPAWLSEGVDIAIVTVTRNAPSALDPAIKSNNLLNNLLAWMEAKRSGAYEPILLSARDEVAEGASSNVFAVREGRLLTPPTECGILRGITRQLVLDLVRGDGLPVVEEPLVADDLRRADEAFITSTLKGVLPVRRCDGWPIRDGRPGPMTRRVLDLFDAAVQAETKAGSSPGSMRR